MSVRTGRNTVEGAVAGRFSGLEVLPSGLGAACRRVALFGALAFGGLTYVAQPVLAQSFEVTNPLVLQRADPHIYRHTDGYYYFTATVPAYNRIELRRAPTIQGLSTATPTVIWNAHPSGEMASHIWAPEIHYIDESWYIYFAAGSSSNVWDIRVYVLTSDAENPLTGAWNELGQLVTNGPKSNGAFFALDATTFEHRGVRYLVWAESDPSLNVNTVLYIAPMSNPWTLSRRGVRISAPEHEWETRGYAVNEGAAVLKRNGKIFISYSASATDANYCVGLLTAEDSADLLDPQSWSKAQQPVLRSGNGIYGPGHNQFTTSPDGSVDLLVYHARDFENIAGDPLDDPNRATRVQPLTWNDDGTPRFGGIPLADGTLTIEGGDGTAGAPGTGGAGGAPGAAGTAGAAGADEPAGTAGVAAAAGRGGSSPGAAGGVGGIGGDQSSGGNAGSPSSSGGTSTTGGHPGLGATGGTASGGTQQGNTGGQSSGGQPVASGAGGSAAQASSGGALATGGSNVGGTTARSIGGGTALSSGASGVIAEGGSTTSAADDSTSDQDESGCGCRMGGRPVSGWLWALVPGLGISLRRRSRSATRAPGR